ncbi:hypothetical protein ACP70R_046394 [Stipagrostis hirtigluma subsp. patula]
MDRAAGSDDVFSDTSAVIAACSVRHIRAASSAIVPAAVSGALALLEPVSAAAVRRAAARTA